MLVQTLAPRDSVREFREEMDRLLSGFIGNFAEGWAPSAGRPAVNVWENSDAFFVELEVPGLSEKRIDLAVADNELTIKIHRSETQGDAEGEQITYHRRERPTGESIRVLQLPTEIDADRVTAAVENGVLEIALPKAEKVKPKKIAVKPGD